VTLTVHANNDAGSAPVSAIGVPQLRMGTAGTVSTVGVRLINGPPPHASSSKQQNESAMVLGVQRGPIQFGREATPSTRGTANATRLEFRSIRIASEVVDGKLMEIFVVPTRERQRDIAGFVIRVDNKLHQMIEIDDGGTQGRISKLRMVTFDDHGRQVSDVDADVSRLDLKRTASREATFGSRLLASCGALIGRVASGVTDVLLPATLHANSLNNCDAEEQIMVAAGISALGAAAWAAVTTAACVAAWWTCADALAAQITTATLMAVYATAVYYYWKCTNPPPPCGEFENDPCPGEGGSGGSGSGGGEGGGGGGSGIGGFVPGGWAPGGNGLMCNWYITNYVQNGTFYTSAAFFCI
jgi:hypothetical protein